MLVKVGASNRYLCCSGAGLQRNRLALRSQCPATIDPGKCCDLPGQIWESL